MKDLYKFFLAVALFISAGIGSAYAQDDGKRRISGTVTDENGEPLTGAYVYIKDTQVGTTTNLDGIYVIDIDPNDELTFSFVGFLEKTVKPRPSSNTLNVKLEADALMAEEAVVIAYGAQKREALVSSVSTITTDDIRVSSSNVTSGLQGKLPGLISVQRSAEPGRDDAEFWIRGVSTFKGGSKPLVLVDGIPRDLGDIEPDEIDSYSLLKDAAATAVYGAEGANGVILITTKRGLISKPQITLRVEESVSSPYRLPEFVDSWTYMELANEALTNDGFDPQWTPQEIDLYRQGVDPDLYPNVDWMDELVNKAVHSQRYTINFRGGAENAKYFVSGGYYQTDGIWKKNPDTRYNSNFSYERYSLRSNIDLKVSKTTNISIDLAGQYVNKRRSNRTSDEIFGYMLHTPPYLFPPVYSDGTLATYPTEGDANNRNPYNMLYNQGYRKFYTTQIQSKVTINQDLNFITDGLSAKGIVSFDYDAEAQTLRDYWPSLYHATGRDENGNLEFSTVSSGSPNLEDPVFASNTYTRKIYIEGSLNYSRVFANKHAIGAMLLYNMKERQLNKPVLPYRKQGLVGRVTYGYDNRYFIEANFGYTGSETFAKGRRFGFFPAVGVSYLISNESFYPEDLKKVLSNAKIRLSYGRTGNDDTGGDRFLYRAQFFSGEGFEFYQGYGSNGGTSSSKLGDGIYDELFENLTLGWEIETKRNVGIDLGFFTRNIQLSLDYFNNTRSGILLQRNTIPGVAGFHEKPWQNYGIVNNWGVDASLELYKKFGDWTVSARGTFTFARNKILEYDELTPLYDYQRITGTRVNEQEVYIAERLYTQDDFIVTENSNGTFSYELKPGLPDVALNGTLGPGDIKYKDMNNDGIIDSNDKVRGVGHPYTPEINYGFGFNVEWKGIYASVFFTGVANSSVLLASGNNHFWPFNWGVDKGNYRTQFLDRWTADNPSQDVTMPRIHSHYNYNVNKEPNTWWLRDGSFLRLKNVEIGYELPKKALDAIRLDGVRFYILGENLCVWDHIKYWDPEMGNENGGMSYPRSRTFTFGVQIDF